MLDPKKCATAKCRTEGAHQDYCPYFLHSASCKCKYCRMGGRKK